MAVELTLQNGRWSGRALRQFLEAWAPKAPHPLLTWSPWESGPQGMRAWIFGEGSTRGVTITRRMSLIKGAPVTLRLNAMASRADWSLGYALLRSLVKARGGRVESAQGRVLRPEDLADSEAIGDALAHLREDAQQIASRLAGVEHYAAFPNPEFSQLITEDMLPAERDPARFALLLEELLRTMAARYQRAQRAPLTTLPDGTSFSIWSMNEALIYGAKHVGVRPTLDAQEGSVWELGALLSVLGERPELVAEDLERFYLPALDPGDSEDRGIRERLMKEGTPLNAFLARFQRSSQGAF